MAIQISRITGDDIPGVITAIQKAFAEDPVGIPASMSYKAISNLTTNSMHFGCTMTGPR